MSPLEIKCPRCGSTWRVSEEKAGKKGRCPQCWGIIKVPDKKAAPELEHRFVAPPVSGRRKAFLIGAAVVLVAGIVLAVALRKGAVQNGGGPEEEVSEEALAAIRQLNLEINQLARLEDRCNLLDDLAREERCLQAREVLRKDKAYEPVSAAEYALRASVREEEAAARAAAEKNSEPPPQSWQLDVPLKQEDRPLLAEKSNRLIKESADIKAALAQMGIKAPERRDPLGRAFVDTAEARKLLAARSERLEAAVSEARSGNTGKQTAP